jgi:uncharacterized protein (TIGR00369 family)
MHDLKMDKDALCAFLQAEFPQVSDDIKICHLAPMRLGVMLNVRPGHLRPGGTVSGPAMFGLADVGVYLTLLSMIGPRALSVTTQGSIDFLRKPSADRNLQADIELVKLGRRLAVGDVRMFSEGAPDALVARATLTYIIT